MSEPEKLAEMLDLSGTKVEGSSPVGPGDRWGRRCRGVEDRRTPERRQPRAGRCQDLRRRGLPCRLWRSQLRRGGPGSATHRWGPISPASRYPNERSVVNRVRECCAPPPSSGISKDHSGILVLPPDSPLNEAVTSLLGLDDVVFELEITSNRRDCLGVIGVAREVSVILDTELKVPEVNLPGSPDVASPVSVSIEDRRGCPRYLARYIEGVSIGASPTWMAARLLAAGMRPISNVVDATNYVMLEYGQPLHAFDGDLVKEQSIIVRRAKRGEKLTTLDGLDRVLDPEDLVIADPKQAVALAGVIGGGDSEVGDATRNVILEAAHFDAETVAFTARRHQVRTEASARFERGSDPEIVPVAAARAAAAHGRNVWRVRLGDGDRRVPGPQAARERSLEAGKRPTAFSAPR